MKQRMITRDGKRVVKIAFLTPNDTSFFSSIAAWFTSNKSGKTFSHVEMMFSDGSVTSITADPGKVHYDESRFLSNPSYRYFFEIYLSRHQEQAMEAYARACAEREIPFNKSGMYWNFVCPCIPIRKEGKALFCSEYVTRMLQTIGYLPDLDSAKTSPNDLYLALKNCRDVHVGVNTKLYNEMIKHK